MTTTKRKRKGAPLRVPAEFVRAVRRRMKRTSSPNLSHELRKIAAWIDRHEDAIARRAGYVDALAAKLKTEMPAYPSAKHREVP